VRAFGSDELTVEDGLRRLWFATSEAAEVWDDESWTLLAARVDMARAAGALSVLSLASARGRWRTARGRARRGSAGDRRVPRALRTLGLAAWHGREHEVDDLVEAAPGDAIARGEALDWAPGLQARPHALLSDARSSA
jgi:hypothetical protein